MGEGPSNIRANQFNRESSQPRFALVDRGYPARNFLQWPTDRSKCKRGSSHVDIRIVVCRPPLIEQIVSGKDAIDVRQPLERQFAFIIRLHFHIVRSCKDRPIRFGHHEYELQRNARNGYFVFIEKDYLASLAGKHCYFVLVTQWLQ